MRMTVTTSGGWAGLVRRHDIDLADLPPVDAAAVENAVRALAADPPVPDHRLRDARWYVFEILDGDAAWTLRVQEISCGPQGRTLLRIIRSHVPSTR